MKHWKSIEMGFRKLILEWEKHIFLWGKYFIIQKPMKLQMNI